MQTPRYSRINFMLALLLLMGAAAQPSAAQRPTPSAVQAQPGLGPPGLPGASDPGAARMEAARVKLMNDDRHKRLVSDTDKLVQLATELQAEVAKSSKDELSVEVIRKADQMEKLAHDIKERMKN